MAERSGHARREAFDEVAERYDRARPGYPAELIEDLADLAGLRPGSRVLEVACGTGQLTVSLARLGVSVVGVELGPRLAALARRNVAEYDRVEVVGADFESWTLPPEPFDAVTCAMAFHWLDPDVRVHKSADALRPGGSLAVVRTHHVAGGTPGFEAAMQGCYARWDPRHDADFRLSTVDEFRSHDGYDLSQRFGADPRRWYPRDVDHTSQTFADLVGTYPPILAMDPDAREGLLSCLADVIDTRFGGRITRRYLTELQVVTVVT